MGFSLFGPYHMGWLMIITIIVVFSSKQFKKLDTTKRKRTQRKLAWFIVLLEIAKISYLIINNEFKLKYLPFELCSFAIFAIFYHAYTDNRIVGDMLYNLFLPGAITALLFCNWTHRPIYQFMSLFSFVFHFALVLYCVMVLYAGVVKPNIRRIRYSILFLIVATLFIYPLNKVWDTNFMFLNVPSPGSPLVPLEKVLGNPGYILGLGGIIALLWTVLYLPWSRIRLYKSRF